MNLTPGGQITGIIDGVSKKVSYDVDYVETFQRKTFNRIA